MNKFLRLLFKRTIFRFLKIWNVRIFERLPHSDVRWREPHRSIEVWKKSELFSGFDTLVTLVTRYCSTIRDRSDKATARFDVHVVNFQSVANLKLANLVAKVTLVALQQLKLYKLYKLAGLLGLLGPA